MRAVVRAITRVCGERLLLHAVVDDHVHVVARTKRAWVLGRELARAIRLAVPGVELFDLFHARSSRMGSSDPFFGSTSRWIR